MTPSSHFKHLFISWCYFFIYTCIVAIIIQFIIIPYWLPDMHWGDGLLSVLDSTLFHQIAVDLSEKISKDGWSSWVIRPSGYGYDGQGPAGIAAAIYALTVPKPWTLIPLNAAIHATTGILLTIIYRCFSVSYRNAIYGAIPFIVFPAAATWYAQIHKDGFTTLGSLLFIYGWILFGRQKTWKSWLGPIIPLASIYIGSVLVWTMRPYFNIVLQAAAIVPFFITTIYLFIFWRKKITYFNKLAGICTMILALFLVTPYQKIETKLSTAAIQSFIQVKSTKGEIKTKGAKGEIKTKGAKAEAATKETHHSGKTNIDNNVHTLQKRILNIFQHKINMLLGMREGFRGSSLDAGSSIDKQLVITSTKELIVYIPRAFQIAFLAPFPNEWFSKKGTNRANTYMRILSSFEMIFIYFCLFFFPLVIIHWKSLPQLWITLSLTTSPIIIMALTINNVGTLYRMRYGLLMTIVGLCIIGVFSSFNKSETNILK